MDGSGILEEGVFEKAICGSSSLLESRVLPLRALRLSSGSSALASLSKKFSSISVRILILHDRRKFSISMYFFPRRLRQ